MKHTTNHFKKFSFNYCKLSSQQQSADDYSNVMTIQNKPNVFTCIRVVKKLIAYLQKQYMINSIRKNELKIFARFANFRPPRLA